MKTSDNPLLDLLSMRAINDGTKGTCPECDRVLGVVNPLGGDGSIRVMLHHNKRIDGVYGTGERCPGTRQPAKEWALPKGQA